MFQAQPAIRRHLVRLLAVALFLCLVAGDSARSEETLPYFTPDDGLTVVRIDSSATESFLSIRADSRGRVFVGGREALFVYEPDGQGGYRPRQELYRFPEHSWVYDIEIRGRDLYVLTLSALYVLPGGVEQLEGLQPRRLIWGVPLGHVHQCFHGLAWGPEGDLYISQGDPLWYYGDFDRPDHWGHWTFFSQPVGTRTPYTGVGGIFRCRPDGSHFEVVATGLRNSCGLAFDYDWNLFTNDNDHEGMPHAYVPGRLLHVTRHAYFSWPRGWMPSITPDRADLLETMISDMGRSVPVGQTYYKETFLPAKYRDNLLVARWGRRTIGRYPLTENGASFRVFEFPLLEGRDMARPVGVAVGRGGRIFATISYMSQNEGSPTYQSDFVMITRADDPDSYPFDAYDASRAAADRLWRELSNPSWWRRYRAHTELLRRGGDTLTAAAARLQHPQPSDPATVHLIWLAAAVARDAAATEHERQASRDLLIRFASARRERVRRHAVRAAAEFFVNDEALRPVFFRALSDRSVKIQHAAVLAFFDLDGPLPKEIVIGPARSDDTYLRQAATLLLAARATRKQLQALCQSTDSRVRLAGVLAAGFRLTLPAATEPIPENLPLEPWRNEDAYRLQFADKKVDLRDFGRIGLFTVAEHWNAGARSDEQEELFSLLQSKLDDRDEQIRLQAAHFLRLLNDARSELAVARVRSDSERQRLTQAGMRAVDELWAVGPFFDGQFGFDQVHEPEQSAVDLSGEYKAGRQKLTWQRKKRDFAYNFQKLFGAADYSSFYTYCRLESSRKQQIMLLVGSDDGVKVWRNGELVWANDVVRAALPAQDVIYIDLQPGSNDLLIRVSNQTGQCMLYLYYRSLGEIAVTLPEKLGIASLTERLKLAVGKEGPTNVPAEFLDVDWAEAARTGDAERGRQLFSAEGLGCAKCHAVRPDQAVEGGPSLAEAGKRFTIAHLVESVMLPSKQVSPVFRATAIATENGQTFTCLVVGETAEKLDVLLPDGKRTTIAKSEIAERKLEDVSPMPAGVVKTPEELRHLLAYMLQ